MHLAIALVALQAAAPAPQPGGRAGNPAQEPSARTNSPSPPAVVVGTPRVRMAVADRPDSSPVLVDIRVSGDDRFIWEDSLRVEPSASYSVNRSESRAASCSDQARHHTVRSGLTVNLSSYRSSDRLDSFDVSVSWSRSADPQICGEPGTRTVEIRQTVQLAPGAERILRGDGGLSIRLRRR